MTVTLHVLHIWTARYLARVRQKHHHITFNKKTVAQFQLTIM